MINKETILLDDFNVDYLTPGKFDKDFVIEGLRSHNFKQLIKEITRPLSKACLDHVWCTHPEHLNNATVLSSGKSDHLPVHGYLENMDNISGKHGQHGHGQHGHGQHGHGQHGHGQHAKSNPNCNPNPNPNFDYYFT